MYVIRSFPASIKLDAARLHNEIKNMKSLLGCVAYNLEPLETAENCAKIKE